MPTFNSHVEEHDITDFVWLHWFAIKCRDSIGKNQMQAQHPTFSHWVIPFVLAASMAKLAKALA